METVETTIENLRKVDKRITPQLLEVLKFMEGNTSHPSAANVYDEVRKIFPTISLNTVYNILKTLSATGQIQEVSIDRDRSKFDPNVAIHHHIICNNCKKIDDIFVELVDLDKLPSGITAKYDIKDYHLDLYGFCQDCQNIGT